MPTAARPRRTSVRPLPDEEARLAPSALRNIFITFEGGEGAGKSTQLQRLAERLRAAGAHVVTTREPGGSPGAEAVRHVLLAGAAQPLGPLAEAVLFAAARADHVDVTIRPALNQGAIVLSDRFADSTRVYQGVLGNVDPRVIRLLERVALAGVKPDLTVILDLPAEEGLARARARSATADRFEAEGADFHRHLREAFRDLAENEPQRCVLVDASGKPETVEQRIWSAVAGRLQAIATAREAAT